MQLKGPGKAPPQKKSAGGTQKLFGFIGTLRTGGASSPRSRPGRRDPKTVIKYFGSDPKHFSIFEIEIHWILRRTSDG